MRIIRCPYCSKILFFEIAKASLKHKDDDVTINCKKCNNRINVTLPNWSKSSKSVPFGIFFGLMIGGIIYLPIEHVIKIRLIIGLATFSLVLFTIILVYSSSLKK
jgi:hypothetical protein